MAATRQFTLVPFAARLAISIFLVFATYNPSGYSYYHWAIDTHGGPPALKVMVGLAIALLYTAVLRVIVAAFRRSGLALATLAGLLFGGEAVIVLLPDGGPLSWNGWVLIGQYIVLVALGLIIAFGISWSHIIERLTGQQQKRYVRR
jgi:hypothetical protein